MEAWKGDGLRPEAKLSRARTLRCREEPATRCIFDPASMGLGVLHIAFPSIHAIDRIPGPEHTGGMKVRASIRHRRSC